MKKLVLNREYATRHLAVALLMLGLSGWFGYDGFVRYPATPAAELYRSIEGSEAPEGCDLRAFKDQKTKTQYGFTFLTFAAALIIGFRLYRSWKFDFAYDDDSFVYGGRTFPISGISKVDSSKWKTKGILLVDGIRLDAWHHAGVKEFAEKVEGLKG